MTEPVDQSRIIHAGTATLTLTAVPGAATLMLGSSMWLHWGLIAGDHETRAWAARKGLLARFGEDNSSRLFQPEWHATMVAVTSVAFAIEALHLDLIPKVKSRARTPNP